MASEVLLRVGLRLLAVILLFGPVLWTSLAHGQDAPQLELPDVEAPCAPEVTENRTAVLEHGGQPGLWFHREVARCMLGRLQALPLYSRQVSLLENRLTLQNERDALQERRVTLAEEEAETAAGALEAAVRGRREAEEERDAWYRHPAFWYTVGTAVTVALEALAIWGFSQISL